MKDRRHFDGADTTQASITEESGDCGCSHNDLPFREDFGLSPFENMSLDIFRCVCSLYSTSNPQTVSTAYDLCERALGASAGPLFVARITALLRAVKAERKAPFTFLTPGCLRIVQDEVAVISVLQAAQDDKPAKLKQAAVELAASADVSRIMTAALLLAQDFGNGRLQSSRAMERRPVLH